MDSNEIRKMYKTCAQKLGDFELISKTELANGYCQATDDKDEDLRSAYFSAIILRYWYKIQKTKEKNPINLTYEDAYDIVVHGIQYALEHQAWKDETKSIYNDPNGPDKIINRCIDSSYLIYMQTSNKDVRKANANNLSIDKETEENGDSALDFMGVTNEGCALDGTKIIVQSFINKNKLMEALVVDGIVNGDSFKANKEDSGSDSTFDMRKLVKHLNNIGQKYIQEIFATQYDMKEGQVEELELKLSQLNNIKLYKYIKKTIIEIKDNPELLTCLLPDQF